ncbi:MAG TPA: hypothetical protein VF170_13190 [Planctomycetaceae bacterium]
MRPLWLLIPMMAVIAIATALFTLRGCATSVQETVAETPSTAESEEDVLPETPPESAPKPPEPVQPDHGAPAAADSAPVAPPADAAPSPVADGPSAAEALADAKAAVADAERVARSDAGEAFRLYAEAYAAVSAHPSDPACAELAASLVPKLRQTATRANAAADPTGDETLIEE